MQPIFFETDNITEWSIPVTLPAYTEWRRVYCMAIGPVCVGDLIDVFAETEFQNNVGYNVEVVTQISLLPGPTPSYSQDLYDYAGQGADFVCKPAGENVNPERHYYQLSRGTKHRVAVDIPSAYLLLRARCRSTVANGANITVPYGYGKLSAFVWKP